MMETTSYLRAQHLQKSYNGRMVVKDVSIDVYRGEVVGLLGPNGAGKTTSFYMMVGLVKADSGKITLSTPSGVNAHGVPSGAVGRAATPLPDKPIATFDAPASTPHPHPRRPLERTRILHPRHPAGAATRRPPPR